MKTPMIRSGFVLPVISLACFAAGIIPAPAADQPALLDGNLLGNPGFEYDWHHNGAEGHVLAFMGDWSFNAADGKPDYWTPAGAWEYADGTAHSGSRSLLLKGGASVTRTIPKATTKGGQGGGDRRWGNPGGVAMNYEPAVRLARTVRASVWYRSDQLGGANRLVLQLTSGHVTKTAAAEAPAPAWSRLDVTVTREEIEAAYAAGKAKGVMGGQSISIKVVGKAEVYLDDVSMAEEQPEANLAVNGGFEDTDKEGAPVSWSQPQKYRFYTQQYYKWTSWHHFFGSIRGRVDTTDLVAHGGKRSLLMQVYPGDEMLVTGGEVELKQTQPGIVEIGAFVQLDRVKWIDIRARDQDGNEIPCADAFGGGYLVPSDNGQIYPSNAREWIYVRKCFLADKPLKGIRPQLCARGFNGDTRDDGGTRPNVNQTGLAWWDDIRVVELTATTDELKQRGMKIPAAARAAPESIMIDSLDLGQRLYGQNTATVVLVNPTRRTLKAEVSLAVLVDGGTGAPPATLVSAAVEPGQVTSVNLPYQFTAADLRGVWTRQGHLKLDVKVGGKIRSMTLAYNTWPVIVDVDPYRHYATPDENPQAVAFNFGVADGTLRQTKSLVIEIRRGRDGKVIDAVRIPDLAAAMAQTRANFAELSKATFGTPSPVQFADRRNLLALALDLGKIPVRPQNDPCRDHYLRIAGLDAAGKESLSDISQPLGRVQPNQEILPPIAKTEVRQDGAVLINGSPVFLMAGNGYTTGHYGLNGAMIKKTGFNCVRWVESIAGAEANWKDNLYSLETMVGKGGVNDKTLPVIEATLAQAAKEGKLAGVVTISPFYESSSALDTPKQSAWYKQYTEIAHKIINRISNFGGGGAHNIYSVEKSFDDFDSFGLEIEPFGPPRGGYELAPALRKGGKAWFHLPQTYNCTPFESFRFDQYVMILQGGRGVSTIHGLGDPSFMRGITGEMRHLSPAIFSSDTGADGTAANPDIWWMQRKADGITTIIALNKPPVEIGLWTWRDDTGAPGGRAHTGLSAFTPWQTPDGLRLHGFRETKPVVIQKDDKIVQYVLVDPTKPPATLAWGVRGDAKWDFNTCYGKSFDFKKWRDEFIPFWFGGELLPGTWQIAWQYNDLTRDWFADHILTPASFKDGGAMPKAGEWTKLERSADELGLVGKQVDGFFFLAKDGEAWWAQSAIVRGDRQIVLCGSTLGAGRDELAAVRFAVPWAKDGTRVKVLFEDRELRVKDGEFVDDFRGEDIFLTISGGALGDAVGWHAPGTDLKAQTIGYVTPSGPAALHAYEIPAR